MKNSQYLHTLRAILCVGFVALAGCSSQPASELATGRWGMPDGSGMMLIDLPHGKLEIWRAFAGGGTPVFKAKNMKIVKEERDPQQVTVSYDVSGHRRTMTFRILWQQDGERFNLAIADQFSGKITSLSFMSASPEPPQMAGGVE